MITCNFLVNHEKLKPGLIGTVLIKMQTSNHEEALDQQRYSNAEGNLWKKHCVLFFEGHSSYPKICIKQFNHSTLIWLSTTTFSTYVCFSKCFTLDFVKQHM